MFILEPFAYPFILLFKWIASLFLMLSNGTYWVYSKFLGASIWLNDAVESNIWPRD